MYASIGNDFYRLRTEVLSKVHSPTVGQVAQPHQLFNAGRISVFSRSPFSCQRIELQIRASGMTIKATTIRRLSDLEVFSIANALTEDTGLPMVIYIIQKNAPHGPRIKVSKSYGDKVIQGNWFTMTIEQNPRVIGKVGRIRGLISTS